MLSVWSLDLLPVGETISHKVYQQLSIGLLTISNLSIILVGGIASDDTNVGDVLFLECHWHLLFSRSVWRVRRVGELRL
jgi:hypothetical protein